MTMGQKLRAAREQMGKTMLEVAIETGVGRSALSMYEIDARVPRDNIKRILARYYARSIQELFYDESDTNSGVSA